MKNTVDPRLCDTLKEGILTYFNGETMSTIMLRLRGQPGMERYDLLIDEQMAIGWDSLLQGKFSKQWKILQKAYYVTIRKLRNPILYARIQRRKKEKRIKTKTNWSRGKIKQKNSMHFFNQ
jgi:hypothetical protein